MDEQEIQAAQLGFNYDIKYTGEQLDEAITKVLNGYVYPEGTIEITDTTETDVSTYATAVISDDNLKSENIVKGVTILGVTGTMSGTEDMVSTALEVDSFVGDAAVTYTPTSEDNFNCYASVTVNPISYTETTNVYGTTITIG